MDLALQGFGDSFIAIYKVTNTTGDTGYLLLIQRSGAWCRGNREERNRRGRQRSVGPQRRRRLRKCSHRRRGPPLHAGFRNPEGKGRSGNADAVVRCWHVAAIWAQIAWPSGWAELVPLLGLPALGSHHKIFFYSSGVVRIFSLTKFQFNRGSC